VYCLSVRLVGGLLAFVLYCREYFHGVGAVIAYRDDILHIRRGCCRLLGEIPESRMGERRAVAEIIDECSRWLDRHEPK